MPKKTMVADDAESTPPPVSKHNVIRVEESVEDFLRLMMPSVPGTRLSVCLLFKQDRSTFFRCKYYKYSMDSQGYSDRKEVSSRFVRVDDKGNQKYLVDLTKSA